MKAIDHVVGEGRACSCSVTSIRFSGAGRRASLRDAATELRKTKSLLILSPVEDRRELEEISACSTGSCRTARDRAGRAQVLPNLPPRPSSRSSDPTMMEHVVEAALDRRSSRPNVFAKAGANTTSISRRSSRRRNRSSQERHARVLSIASSPTSAAWRS
jgi:hypothetical protein